MKSVKVAILNLFMAMALVWIVYLVQNWDATTVVENYESLFASSFILLSSILFADGYSMEGLAFKLCMYVQLAWSSMWLAIDMGHLENVTDLVWVCAFATAIINILGCIVLLSPTTTTKKTQAS